MQSVVQPISPFETVEIVYYGAIIAGAVLSSVFQTIRSTDYRGVRYVLGSGMVSGLLAFSVITFVDGDFDVTGDDRFFYLGISVAIGLTVEWQQDLIRLMFLVIMHMIRASLKRMFDIDIDKLRMDEREFESRESAANNDGNIETPTLDNDGSCDVPASFDNDLSRQTDRPQYPTSRTTDNDDAGFSN